MNCQRCGAASEVKSTRSAAHGTTARRRECFNGHRFTTYEVYEPTFKSNARDLARTWARIVAAATRWARDRRIILDPRGASSVAAEAKLTEARVRQIRASARYTHPGLSPGENPPAGSSGAQPKKGKRT